MPLRFLIPLAAIGVALFTGCSTTHKNTSGDTSFTVIVHYENGAPVKAFQAAFKNYGPSAPVTDSNGVAKLTVPRTADPQFITVQNLPNSAEGTFSVSSVIGSLLDDIEYDITLAKCPADSATPSKKLTCIALAINAVDSTGKIDNSRYPSSSDIVKANANQYGNPNAVSVQNRVINYYGNQSFVNAFVNQGSFTIGTPQTKH